MSLQAQIVHLADVAETAVTMNSLLRMAQAGRSGVPQPEVTGRCYAFYEDRLVKEASARGLSLHVWLLQLSIAGLWQEHPKKPAFTCYVPGSGVTRLFLCSRQRGFPGKFHKLLSGTGSYMESGDDAVPVDYARPLAHWEPPSTMVALWPPGLEGETSGARVVDTGSLMGYFSYPASDHDHSVPVDLAGPEYVRVPQEEPAAFELGGRTYHYLNRYAVVHLSATPR